ncbi:MAG TPA: GatB/YqeY domain-containing protein [Gammaproteobacteria bacterium]|nr:GatB/YqeY domain-containing protein [Gammaproteobacteria bacterium]
MPSALKDRLSEDVKTAMKAGDKSRLGTLRFVLAAVKQQEIDTRKELDDAAVIAILTKLANQRRESIGQFESAQREDLAAKEREELALVESYLPAPLSAAEIDELVTAAIAKLGAASIKDMGKVMAELRPALTGRADLGAVSAQVKARLGG